jgi:hypothetical protein
MKWMLFLFLPLAVLADEFDNLRANYARDMDDIRRAAIVRAANAPTVATETRTITNVAPASVVAKVQQLGRILTNFAAITSQTGVNYDALKEYALNNAADMTAAQDAMLLACDRLWAEVKDYAPDGLSNFRAVTTNAVTVQVQGPSAAMQRLGREATAEDLKP